jgi:hypothetical protein
VTHVFLSQDFGWDTTATLENLPNGSLAATPLYPPSIPASPLSNSYPGGFNYMDPVSEMRPIANEGHRLT